MSDDRLKLNTSRRFSLQTGTIPQGVTSSGSKYPLNSAGTSILDPNEYFGPTYSPYNPVLSVSENFQVLLDGDWSGKIKPGDPVEMVRGSVRHSYDIQRSLLLLGAGGTYSNPRTLLSFFTNRASVPLLNSFLGTAGYTGPAPDTFLTLDRRVENPNSEISLLRDFSYRIYQDPRFDDCFLAEIIWDIDPSVKATKIRWRSVPRVIFQSTLAFSVNVPGDYTQIPDASVVSSTGRSAKVQLSGSISTLLIEAGGTGYTFASAEAAGGGGTGASFSVTVTSGSITSVAISSGGTGYSSVPSISIVGDGSGASARVETMQVNSLSVLDQGGGYLTAPRVAVDETYLSGTPVEISSSLYISNEGRVDYLRVVEGGSGYTGASVSVTGSFYSQEAVASADIVNGSVANIRLISGGYGYTASSVVITPSGTGGTGAVAVANIDLYSQWVYEDPLYTEKSFTIEGLKYNVPYEVEILVSEDEKFRGLVSYSAPLSLFYFK